MEGPNLAQTEGINENSGILPRAVDFIFSEIKRLEILGVKVELQLACLEIYNETLTDLLGDTSSLNNSLNSSANSISSLDKDGKLVIMHTNNKVIIHNLTWVPIQDHQQLFSLVMKASKARTTDKTSWNER